MGLLSEGSPLSWEKTQELVNHVREHGVTQFINLYHRLKQRQGDILKWGDEVEYIIVKFDHKNKRAHVSLKAEELLNILNEKEMKDPEGVKSLWRPEYGAYMIEGTPGKPYGGLPAHLNIVEANMRYRREEAQELLSPDEVLFSITNFPRLGSPGFTFPAATPTPQSGASQSLFLPEEIIFPGHPRFATLTRNIRLRRGEKVAINIPIFKDVNTPRPFIEDLSQYGETDPTRAKAALPDHVYLDAMGFGMGCCCLQVTFQACNITEAKTLYDQLTPLCPIMLALTAASPIFRGYLTDVDCRWNVISGSVDCRTREERGLEPLTKNRFVIPKSRYDSIDSYLSPESDKYNDIPLIYDRSIYDQLVQNGIDPMLGQHIAHLFIRDTVSLFNEKVHQNDEVDTDHFENIQSTNWQTMRFKPPPPNSPIGWRVEFRPCETQLTDFENAAFVCFVVLLTRIILSYNLNFVIPISKVDENMKRAQKRDALKTEKFWFRRDCAFNTNGPDGTTVPPDTDERPQATEGNPMFMNGNGIHCDNETNNNNSSSNEKEEYVEMTINEIINGKESVFPGLAPLVSRYLTSMDVDTDTHCTIQQYLNLIQKRASGEILTTASWIRNFVTSHPSYKKDSVVTEDMTYDLLLKSHHIQTGRTPCPALLGKCLIQKSKTRERIPLGKSFREEFESDSISLIIYSIVFSIRA
uniref:Glutamate--cysteine ligase n=1 Tax=Cacopsylla melanoneura TaxID=428564 RepID=A0A8D8RA44_9HEMI